MGYTVYSDSDPLFSNLTILLNYEIVVLLNDPMQRLKIIGRLPPIN